MTEFKAGDTVRFTDTVYPSWQHKGDTAIIAEVVEGEQFPIRIKGAFGEGGFDGGGWGFAAHEVEPYDPNEEAVESENSGQVDLFTDDINNADLPVLNLDDFFASLGEDVFGVFDEEVPEKKVQDDAVRQAIFELNDLHGRLALTIAVQADKDHLDAALLGQAVLGMIHQVLTPLERAYPEFDGEYVNSDADILPFVKKFSETNDVRWAYLAQALNV